MEKSLITEVSYFFLKIEITDFGVPFMTYADAIKKLPQALVCLMSTLDIGWVLYI